MPAPTRVLTSRQANAPLMGASLLDVLNFKNRKVCWTFEIYNTRDSHEARVGGKGGHMEALYGYLLLPGPALLVWQAYRWLKDGYWTEVPASTALTYMGCPLPMVSWIGLQKIIDWLLDIPTSLILFVLSIIVVAICAMIEAVLTMPRQGKR